MEVGHDYSRTMNNIIFNKFLEENEEDNQELALALPEKQEREIKEYGMIQF